MTSLTPLPPHLTLTYPSQNFLHNNIPISNAPSGHPSHYLTFPIVPPAMSSILAACISPTQALSDPSFLHVTFHYPTPRHIFPTSIDTATRKSAAASRTKSQCCFLSHIVDSCMLCMLMRLYICIITTLVIDRREEYLNCQGCICRSR